jgi:hypothetical protein
MLIVNSNELRHGRTFLDPAGGKSHNDNLSRGEDAAVHEQDRHLGDRYCGNVDALVHRQEAIGLVSISQCTPIARAWDTRIPGTCIISKPRSSGPLAPVGTE